MSRLYSLWNFIFERSETSQSCSSCLIRKSQGLKKWREKQTDVNRAILGDSEDLVDNIKDELKNKLKAKERRLSYDFRRT